MPASYIVGVGVVSFLEECEELARAAHHEAQEEFGALVSDPVAQFERGAAEYLRLESLVTQRLVELLNTTADLVALRRALGM